MLRIQVLPQEKLIEELILLRLTIYLDILSISLSILYSSNNFSFTKLVQICNEAPIPALYKNSNL